MVNVNSQIPFNLHNQSLPGMGPGDPSYSSSRSASASNSHRPYAPPHQLPHMMLTPAITPVHSRSPSPSRSNSTSNDADEYGRTTPILNVRLVRGGGSGSGTRGRPRGRRDVTVEVDTSEVVKADMDEVDTDKTPRAESNINGLGMLPVVQVSISRLSLYRYRAEDARSRLLQSLRYEILLLFR